MIYGGSAATKLCLQSLSSANRRILFKGNLTINVRTETGEK